MMDRRAMLVAATLASWAAAARAEVSCVQTVTPEQLPRLDPMQPLVIEFTWEGRANAEPSAAQLAVMRRHGCVIEHVRIERPDSPGVQHRVTGRLVGTQGVEPLLAVSNEAAAAAHSTQNWSVSFSQAAWLPDFEHRQAAPRPG